MTYRVTNEPDATASGSRLSGPGTAPVCGRRFYIREDEVQHPRPDDLMPTQLAAKHIAEFSPPGGTGRSKKGPGWLFSPTRPPRTRLVLLLGMALVTDIIGRVAPNQPE